MGNHTPGHAACVKRWALRHPEKYAEYQKFYRLRLRIGLIEFYGGECTCCGESRFEFLALDHKNNDGKQDRIVNEFVKSPYRYYKALMRERREDIQILCHNCNSSIGFYGYCPHHPEVRRDR